MPYDKTRQPVLATVNPNGPDETAPRALGARYLLPGEAGTSSLQGSAGERFGGAAEVLLLRLFLRLAPSRPVALHP